MVIMRGGGRFLMSEVPLYSTERASRHLSRGFSPVVWTILDEAAMAMVVSCNCCERHIRFGTDWDKRQVR
jgi:hypothetical protein